jgi:D-alanine-D-alanine ligase-like ATP-grasp enzyme
LAGYHKSKKQNILYARYADLFKSKGFVYAKTCSSLQLVREHRDVLLSPSLVVDVTNGSFQSELELLLSAGWDNAQQAFYGANDGQQNRTQRSGLSACICFTSNNATPMLYVIKESIELSGNAVAEDFIGLIEQAITEHFADTGYFSSLGLNDKQGYAQQQSMLFSVSFGILTKYGDYQIEVDSISVLSVEQLLSINDHFVFAYFDTLLEYRLSHYVEKVKFRTHIVKLCEESGVELEPSYNKTFVISNAEHYGMHSAYYGSVNSKQGVAIALDKHHTNQVLSEHGFCVNRSIGYSLRDLQDKSTIDAIPLQYPMVLKPTDSKEGHGVVTNIPNAKRLHISAQKLMGLADIDKVLVEEFFEGITYRVLIVCGEVVAVLKFIPANILGDGCSQIDHLILAKNLITKSRIRINNALRLSIFNDGKRWETVLPENEPYVLSHNSHASTGGQSINVTHLFGRRYKDIAEDACRSLGLKNVGIDMIVNAEGEYRILEINSGPALATHKYPKYGSSIDAYSLVLECLLKHTDLGREDNSYLAEMMPFHQ